ncbi:MAG: tail fiber domain-containing protein [Adhaeribacter sp.]
MKSNNMLKKVFLLATLISLGHLAYAQQVPDQELKKNVMPVQNALSYIQQLEPKKFEYNTSKYAKLKLPAGQQYGFLADNMQKVLPELVDSRSQSYLVGKNAYKNATYQHYDLESLIPILVGAIQEQQQQIDQLKRQLAEK